jgi:hypothetical protein
MTKQKPHHAKTSSNSKAPTQKTANTLDTLTKGAAPPKLIVKRVKPNKQARISDQMRTVLEEMAFKGDDLKTASIAAGITYTAAMRAFHRPHIKAAYNQLVADIKANAGQAAYLTIRHMSKAAASETVKLEANKWVAGVDNIAPVKRVEGRFQHSHSFGGYDYGDGAVDITPAPDTASGDDDE